MLDYDVVWDGRAYYTIPKVATLFDQPNRYACSISPLLTNLNIHLGIVRDQQQVLLLTGLFNYIDTIEH